MSEVVVGSILHGAYGDYYEQAICLKHYARTHPETRVKLFAASPHRLSELAVLDFTWAESFELWSEIENERVDQFLQFQVLDPELGADVLAHLSPATLAKMDLRRNRRPWQYLRSIVPLGPEYQLGLSAQGRKALPGVMQRNGIDPSVLEGITVGFLWRHRSAGGAIKPFLQVDADRLVDKYTRIFRRLIDRYGCHVLVCGMKVKRTAENQYRIDAKYPEYGLDLPPASSTHLMGLSWALELEILSRCTLCVVNASGFSEALWIKRNGGVYLVDPPPAYVAKALWRRIPFFGLSRPVALASAIASRSERVAYRIIRGALDRTLRRRDEGAAASA